MQKKMRFFVVVQICLTKPRVWILRSAALSRSPIGRAARVHGVAKAYQV